MRQLGYKKIREGKVAVVILAGGQGTRLGSSKPKGEYDIELPSMKSIFQILTERFLKAQMNAHDTLNLTNEIQTCKMLVMTSAINHDETKRFFEANKYFRGNSEAFHFFQQAVLPTMNDDGKILMESSSKIQMSPNGNGAIFDAINRNQEVKNMLT